MTTNADDVDDEGHEDNGMLQLAAVVVGGVVVGGASFDGDGGTHGCCTFHCCCFYHCHCFCFSHCFRFSPSPHHQQEDSGILGMAVVKYHYQAKNNQELTLYVGNAVAVTQGTLSPLFIVFHFFPLLSTF